AASPQIVQAVLAGTTGPVPPTVAALAKGIAINGLAKKLLLGTILTGAIVAIGFGVGVPTTTTAGQKPDKAMPAKSGKNDAKDAKDAPVAKGKSGITVSGKVVDPDGKPVAGAKFSVSDDEVEEKIAPVGSDAEGRFRFEIVYPKTVRNPRQVIA